MDRHDKAAGHAHRHPEPQPYAALRTKALASLLIEKGFLSDDAVDRTIAAYEHDVGPMIGARIVAHAWRDSGFKRRLLEDGTAAIAEMGFGGRGGEHLVVVENTREVHNVICCTLCSCYPWAVLGLPPSWYKEPAYRSRVVAEPRAVLREFGLELEPTVEIRVWDSSAQIRYMVLPERPAGTEGWNEERLSQLVTRDAMIGVACAREAAAG